LVESLGIGFAQTYNGAGDSSHEGITSLADHWGNTYFDPVLNHNGVDKKYIGFGSEKANPMMLYSQDWVGGYCDNGGNLFAANTTGYWDVIVERGGEYEFELRRWAPEADLPLTASGSSTNKRFDGKGARPIAKARLHIGGAFVMFTDLIGVT
jgi:hypothetical protein